MDGDLIPTFAAHAAALAAADPAALDSVATAFEQMGAMLYAAETAASAACLFWDQGRPAAR